MLLPPWIEFGKQLIGIKEAPGERDNQQIIDWAKVIGGWTESYYKRDSIPWCGLYVGFVLAQVGIEPSKDALRARAWNEWGKKVEPCFGAIMVFTRNGGGHVGFYISEDKDYYHILGGNQSDMVNVARISKQRFLGARWPSDPRFDKFHVPGRIVKKFDGIISTNEA